MSPIDIREDESCQEYADRKERELMNMMRGAVGDAADSDDKICECARAMADAVDAYVLNKVMKRLDNES